MSEAKKYSAPPYNMTGVIGVGSKRLGSGFAYAASPAPIHLLRQLHFGVIGITVATKMDCHE